MNRFPWDEGFALGFDFSSGLPEGTETVKRYFSDMKSMYQDRDAAEHLPGSSNPCIYEYCDLGCPERDGDLAFGTTVLYPGRIGNEYFMTKGHFHSKLMTAEVYFTLNGTGLMLIENREGNCREFDMSPGRAVYVPRGFAHRSVNTGSSPLVFFYSYPADAGHDYGSIETSGFRHIVLHTDEGPKVQCNPRWEGA